MRRRETSGHLTVLELGFSMSDGRYRRLSGRPFDEERADELQFAVTIAVKHLLLRSDGTVALNP
jgi:hypothetical protein